MREVDEAARNGVASAKHDELLQRLHKSEDALQATTKDYILGADLHVYLTKACMLFTPRHSWMYGFCLRAKTSCGSFQVHPSQLSLDADERRLCPHRPAVLCTARTCLWRKEVMGILAAAQRNTGHCEDASRLAVMMRVGRFVAGKKARAEAEQRAAAAEAELKEVRSQLGARVAQLEGELSQRLHDARSTAEERLEQHTEAYRAQVRKILAPKHPITFKTNYLERITYTARHGVNVVKHPITSKCTRKETRTGPHQVQDFGAHLFPAGAWAEASLAA